MLRGQTLLFYRGDGPTTAIYSCDVSGGSTFNLSGGWTHIIHRQNYFQNGASYLFYNSISGLAVTTKDAHENLRDVQTYNLASGWTHVVQVESANKILFYNSSTGAAAITGSNIYATIRNQNLAGGWTHIVPSGNNILFYNAKTGAATLTNISFETISTHSMAGGWTQIVPTGRGMLFYNSNSGASTLTQYNNFRTIETFSFTRGWTQIVNVNSCGNLLFYNTNTGAGQLMNNNFRVISNHTMAGQWKIILGITVLL